jgi:hypothetical protein
MGLNPSANPDFSLVYIDDVIVFFWNFGGSSTATTLGTAANLKLKLPKYRFIQYEVQYLGNVIIPQGVS